MNINTLRLLRNILLRSVVIGIGFTLLLAIVTFGFWNSWIVPVEAITHSNDLQISGIVGTLFTEIRFFLVFLLLTPALALHWTIKAEEKRGQKLSVPGDLSSFNPENPVAHAS